MDEAIEGMDGRDDRWLTIWPDSRYLRCCSGFVECKKSTMVVAVEVVESGVEVEELKATVEELQKSVHGKDCQI